MPARAPWVVIQHVAYEGPGSVALAVDDAGATLTVVRVDRGDEIPLPSAVDTMAGLVVMGGPMGVHDDLAWLEDERALLRAAVGADLPVLGVCLGAQQLAAALGGTVTHGAVPECGVGEVHLTADALGDPVLGPAPSPLPCVHWHTDTFSLPDGGVRLARNDTYENQAFRLGPRGTACSSTWRSRPAWRRTGVPICHRECSCAPLTSPTSVAPATASCAVWSRWPEPRRPDGLAASPPSGAARTGGSRRGGSTPPPSGCRCARRRGTR